MVISFLVEKMFVIEYVLIMLPLPEFFSHQLDIPNFLPLLSFYLQRKKNLENLETDGKKLIKSRNQTLQLKNN